MFDQQVFFQALKDLGMSVPKLAELLDINKVTLYRKISGESDFTRKEIQVCREIFGKDKADRIFFAPEVA